jgi:predicted nucleotide-binding protein (sugar kinase/HSP70/actin superfamily)
MYLHPMTKGGASLLAATFRSIGIDARILPPSDPATMEFGNMYSSGEECLPEKITLGDYIKITESENFDPDNTIFLLPTANGPCRFGQYVHLLKNILKKRGMENIRIISPSSQDGYSEIPGVSLPFFRTAWIGLVAADILRKMLLKTRPYENNDGDTERVYNDGLDSLEKILEEPHIRFGKRIQNVREELIGLRNRFRAVDADYVKDKPLIGVLGEIFCRLNTFANEDMIKVLEKHGAETWIADVGEWIFFTDWIRTNTMIRRGESFSGKRTLAKLKNYLMKKDEHVLLEPFHEDFTGYEEPPDPETVVKLGRPYLPAEGALGEMSLSIGQSLYLHNKGVDGIVDISPFSCMNGIVSEAIYPSISKDYDNMPCRVFYYDGINADLDRDIGIYMELVKGYKSQKRVERIYPPQFK